MFLSDWMQRAQKKTNVTSIFVTLYTHQGKNEQHFTQYLIYDRYLHLKKITLCLLNVT